MSKGLSKLFPNTTVQKHQFFSTQLSLYSASHVHTLLLEKRQIFVGKIMPLLLNILSRLIIAFLPGNKHLNFMAADTICSDFGGQKNKLCHYFYCFLYNGKSRHCIKKQRHLFANKELRSQSCSFSSSHVWMLNLVHKEGCMIDAFKL